MLAFRYPLGTALMISASLAQIGEFSFILADLGVGLNLLPEQGRDLILAGAILSILLNPLIFAAADRLRPRWTNAPEIVPRQRRRRGRSAAATPATAWCRPSSPITRSWSAMAGSAAWSARR